MVDQLTGNTPLMYAAMENKVLLLFWSSGWISFMHLDRAYILFVWSTSGVMHSPLKMLSPVIAKDLSWSGTLAIQYSARELVTVRVLMPAFYAGWFLNFNF